MLATSGIQLRVDEQSQVASARREVSEIAREAGFDVVEAEKLMIAVTELAGNLLKHAGGGEIFLRPLDRSGRRGVEILAVDHGAGMDLAIAGVDGYSTAGTSGTGLGAVRRLTDEIDTYSRPEGGTVILARRWAGSDRSLPAQGVEHGALAVPKPGYSLSGDAWLVVEDERRSLLVLADGLGHGQLAAEAAALVIELVSRNAGRHPGAILAGAHEALRHSRGAAVALAEVDRELRRLRFAGVGNVSGRLFLGEESHHLVSHNGTAGREIRSIQEYQYPWPSNALLVLHSDGIAGHWSLDDFPGLAGKDPSVIAGVLYRDLGRGDDDATALVARAG